MKKKTNLIDDKKKDFNIEKQKSLKKKKKIRVTYSVDNAYREVIQLLEVDFNLKSQSIRHLTKILTTNDNNSESLIAKVKHIIKSALIKMRILR